MKRAVELTPSETLKACVQFAIRNGMMEDGTYTVTMNVSSERTILTYGPVETKTESR